MQFGKLIKEQTKTSSFMRTMVILLLLFSDLVVKAQTNTFPASGNVGIGTTSPSGPLDVHGAYYIGGYKFIDNLTPNPSVGFFNPIVFALRQGKILYADEEFATGVNNVFVYDNLGSGQVTITRTNTITDIPNSSGYGLQIKHAGSGESPGYGGFYQSINSGINKTFVQIFRAKLPAGYQFVVASNSVGTGGSNYWLSNNSGTGKWEWYVRVVQSGNAGTFSSSGYVYVTGSPAPTSAAPLIWYMASCTAFDVTNLNSLQANSILNQNTVDQNSSFRISGSGTIGGNVLIGKTSQTNSSYKLDINGNARANKIVVNTTGADFVFDSAYQLPKVDSLNAFIKKYHHLPDIQSAQEMQKQGLDVGENQMKLLQKIEELTLYIIDLRKQLVIKNQAIQQLENINLRVTAIEQEIKKIKSDSNNK